MAPPLPGRRQAALIQPIPTGHGKSHSSNFVAVVVVVVVVVVDVVDVVDEY